MDTKSEQIIFLQSCPSTNTYLLDLLSKGDQSLEEGLIVQAHHQFAGRGYRGADWESNEGENLCFSILLYPKLPSFRRIKNTSAGQIISHTI